MRNIKSRSLSPPSRIKAINRSFKIQSFTTKETTLTQRYQHSIVVIYNNRIKSFSNVEIKNDCSFIDLSLNNLTNFINFPSSLSNLTTLILDNNQIDSFLGIQSLRSFPKLRFLSLKQNPIAQNKYFTIMCLIVFGNQLYSINGEKINDIQHKNANKVRKSLLPHLIQGKIVTNLQPLRFKNSFIEKKIDHTIDLSKNSLSKNNIRKISPKRKSDTKISNTRQIEKVVPNEKIIDDRNDEIENENEKNQKQNKVKSSSNDQTKIKTSEKEESLKNINDVNNRIKEESLKNINDVKNRIKEESLKNINDVHKQKNEELLKINDDVHNRVKEDTLINKNDFNNSREQNASDQKYTIEEHISSEDDIKQIINDNQKSYSNHSDHSTANIKENHLIELVSNESNPQKSETNLFGNSLKKIIVEPSINKDVEMVYEYPEACPYLIFDE